MSSPRAVQLPEPEPALLAAATELADRAALPAGAGPVRFGTAGWTDKTLLACGAFYPKASLSAQARLSFYASHFTLVEVDATYYTLIAPSVSESWAQTSPPGFVFDIKAHPILTGHPIDVGRLPRDLRDACATAGLPERMAAGSLPKELASEVEKRFLATLEPLQRAGKLGAVLLQFPPWFSATRGNVARLRELRARRPDLPFAVEFRHKSWLAEERQDRVAQVLEDEAFSYVVVDEPQAKIGGVPPTLLVTNPELSVVRFHGHNVAGWNRRGASVHQRFDWLYSPEELRAWVEPVRSLAKRAKKLHVVFNNCVRNYAVLGAKGLSVLLEGP